MFRPRYNGSLLIFASAMFVFASSAEAQRATGPFSGVLGAIGDPEATHTLDARGALFGSWDDTLSRTEGNQPVDERFLRSGASSGASGSLSHVRRSSRLTWQSGAASSVRFSGGQGGARAGAFSAQTSGNTSLNRRLSLSLSGGWAYSPYYGFAPAFDGRLSNVGAFGGGYGGASAAERNTSASATAGLTARLSRRDSLSINGNANRYKFLDSENLLKGWSAGAQFSHTITRSLGFHAGYGRQENTYGFAGEGSAITDTIDVGVDYGDTLQFARRTSFAFKTSTSAVKWNNATHYRLNGSAGLSRGFGRSGSASLMYDRDTEFNAGFREPLLRDAVSGGVSNQFNRRTTWSAQAAYLRGNIGFESGAAHYTSYTAGGSLNVALTRRIGMFTDYSVYHYDVPAGSTVFSSLSKFSRQTVSAGMSLWAPLISDKRSSRDSR
jgi:hypothetical protein